MPQYISGACVLLLESLMSLVDLALRCPYLRGAELFLFFTTWPFENVHRASRVQISALSSTWSNCEPLLSSMIKRPSTTSYLSDMVTVYRQHHLVGLHLLALNNSQLIPQLFIRNYMSSICLCSELLISNPLRVELSPLPLFLSVVLASWHRTGGTV